MKKLSWVQIDAAADDLSKKITSSGFEPDYIIGISKGGLIPLGLLAKRLNISNVLTISAKSYENKKRNAVSVMYLPAVDLKNQRILLVDEIADSGNTLKEIARIMTEKYSVAELRTATIVVNTEHCDFYPDCWAIAKTGEWVVFPWDHTD